MVRFNWNKLLASSGRRRDAIDDWHIKSLGLRQILKGWRENMGKQARVPRARILAEIQEFDAQADLDGLDEEGWAFRYL
jgi:hypothetical protein